ncbi:hypothetical protein, partial [Stieleria varia]|uniref:hypothetical protein n=1 Tax=Stieleria varia TaxID=2528005 RepID=UPI001E2BD9EC
MIDLPTVEFNRYNGNGRRCFPAVAPCTAMINVDAPTPRVSSLRTTRDHRRGWVISAFCRYSARSSRVDVVIDQSNELA